MGPARRSDNELYLDAAEQYRPAASSRWGASCLPRRFWPAATGLFFALDRGATPWVAEERGTHPVAPGIGQRGPPKDRRRDQAVRRRSRACRLQRCFECRISLKARSLTTLRFAAGRGDLGPFSGDLYRLHGTDGRAGGYHTYQDTGFPSWLAKGPAAIPSFESIMKTRTPHTCSALTRARR
jgi:hypothetical protein